MTGPAASLTQVGSLALAWRAHGCRSDAAPVVLIHGLGQTLADWPDTLIDGLVAGGRRVLRFDNRDVGRSSRLDSHGAPPLIRLWLAAALRLPPLARPPYPLVDMATDAIGLLDALGVRSAHLVGVSMGGMIAQRIACLQPDRVASLVLVMSSSGAPGLPGPAREVSEAMSGGGSSPDLRSATARALRFRRLLAGELTAADVVELEERVERSSAYGWPEGAGPARQYAAILADRDRYKRLVEIKAPTLVIHGARDPLLPPAHGADIAARIPHARLIVDPMFGHEISSRDGTRLADQILRHAAQAEAGAVSVQRRGAAPAVAGTPNRPA
ncbi:alpha/beta hydrolase [Caulobacter mirabilis]|uniref:alpha/beta hydrolase n=1 Tax=Caulobacter mirabilis TaxID=69666 RepID=UPI001559F0E2|nr:alpha/beta hydrolase [Caulobacter mirabilis]